MKIIGRNIFKITAMIVLAAFAFSCVNANRAEKTRKDPSTLRIISLAPSVTETLFAIGAGKRVVGVTAFCNYPPEVENLPIVGEFARFDFEKILMLHPDIMVATQDAPNDTIKYVLEEYDVSTVIVGPQTIDEAISSIRDIGDAVGARAGADAVAGAMEQRMSSIRAKISGAPKVKTVMVFGHEPLIVGGRETFADDIIKRAGGVNIASDSRIRYPRYSIERLVLEGPDVIIEMAHEGVSSKLTTDSIKSFWSKWPSIPAVKNNRIVIINADLVSRPGPRIVDGLEAVARALHPELFGAEGTQP